MEILTRQLQFIEPSKLNVYLTILRENEFWPSSIYLKGLLKDYKDLEEVVEIYCKLCNYTENYTHFVDCGIHIIVKNCQNGIGNGTTGLTTWIGSQLMLKYCLSNLKLKNKIVVELGCGTGLLGIGCADAASNVILTDSDYQVLELANENITINKMKNCCARHLDWSTVSEISDLPFSLDSEMVVVMADTCYDPSSIPDLCRIIQLFKTHNIKIYMGYSVRNRETFDAFLDESCGTVIYRQVVENQKNITEICQEFVVLDF
eukprot:NODE_31_length_37178_cov_0.413576.p15 type:complete len:261 gc:universal NODE_31_length_37178_cov_0.413576:18870-19652(+)